MKNLKHSIVAVIAVAMISSLAVSQAKELENSIKIPALLSAGANQSTLTVGADDVILESSEEEALLEEEPVVDFDTDIELSEEELQQITQQKSDPQSEYVLLTSGTLSVRANPSDEAEVIDQLDAKTSVKIFESTDGWYKVAYGQGQTGYVDSRYLTTDEEEAEYAAMHYDNYKKAKVTISSDSVRVRKGASTSSEILGELKKGTQVILLWGEGDFVRVCYGTDYEEGYVIATALTIIPDEWVSKDTVSAKQKQIAEAKQKAAAEKAAAEAKKKADAQKKTETKKKQTQAVAKSVTANPPASNKGQAIVNEAKKYLGIKYVWGGSSPKGFDCSGLVQYVCAKNGISVNRTSRAQYKQGAPVSKSNLQPGDLLFFAKNGRVHHVGIYAGNGQMIHAPQTGDVVKYSSINTAYRQKEFVGARRVY